MMKLVTGYYDYAKDALTDGANIEELIKLPVREAIGRFKYTVEENLDSEYQRIMEQLSKEVANTLGKEEI